MFWLLLPALLLMRTKGMYVSFNWNMSLKFLLLSTQIVLDRVPVCIISHFLNGLISERWIYLWWYPFLFLRIHKITVNGEIGKVNVSFFERTVEQLLYGTCWVFLQVEILFWKSFFELFNLFNFFLVILKMDHLLLLKSVLTPILIIVALIFRNIYLLKLSFKTKMNLLNFNFLFLDSSWSLYEAIMRY